ncbi:MAG: LysM peptidoglycan-binding domain-containing protein [Bacteriovoracaceae bacterium]|nr:LysM peptidoglycan-binding domain-containing protein [Bacteriovoracaceae bacterium]
MIDLLKRIRKQSYIKMGEGMLLRFLVVFNLIFLGISCSSKKIEEKEPSVELTEESDMSMDEGAFAESSADEEIKKSEEEVLPLESTQETVTTTTETTAIEEAKTNLSQDGVAYYTVQKNETLMMVAFKIYGDYTKWREISALNTNQLPDGHSLREGMQLAYHTAGSGFSWSPQGNPYLIKWHDTLGTISHDVYQTKKRWRDLWNNNRPLIRDPNKIYAGFTLFYIPDNVASH